MNNNSSKVLETINLSYFYRSAKNKIEILNNINFDLYEGELIALLGPSGSGKTTFLNCIGLIDKPTKGTINISNQKCDFSSDNKITKIRSQNIGFVFQSHRLFPEFSAMENVVIPQLLDGKNNKIAQKNAIEILHYLGLGKRLHHRPANLSGGESQRVAIARAISNAPKIVLADEPTGNLDKETSILVFELFHKVVKASKIGCIVATHNDALAEKMDKVCIIEDKKIRTLKG